MFHFSYRDLFFISITGALILAVITSSLISVEAKRYGYVQANCPTIVQKALDTVSAQCGKTARGKLCYGNSTITAQFQSGVNNVHFGVPGDTVDVSAIKQFTLSGMSTTDNSWGVAEMKIKADLPDADPSQVVTMILFGNVQVTDASADAQTIAATQTMTARQIGTTSQPTAPNVGLPTATPLLSLFDQPTATPAGSKKVSTPTATATRVASKPTPTTVPSGGKGLYSGLQAFYFQSSDTAPCDQAPHDGILIQSPQGNKQRVNLIINGATISLGSTVYITAQPNKFLTINTLEGSAYVTVNGQTQTANAGQAVQVPLGANLRPSGASMLAQLYTADAVRGLPIKNLPSATLVFVPGVPPDVTFGAWSGPTTVTAGGCPSFNTSAGRVAYNDQYLWFGTLVLTKAKDSTYVTLFSEPSYNVNNVPDGYTATFTYTLTVNSPTHIAGTMVTTFDKGGTGCTWTIDLTRDISPSATP